MLLVQGLMYPMLPKVFAEEAETINKLYEKGDKDELKSKLKSSTNNSEVLSSVWSMLKPEVQEELLKLGYKPTSSE